MNTGRLIGILATAGGFFVAALAGLWIATQVSAGQLSSGGAILGAFIAFAFVGPLIGFGIFMFVRGGKEAERESQMAQQRRLLDIVRSRGQVDVRDLALELQSNMDEVKDMVHQLVGLQVFSGYINWDKGVLYSAEASNLRDLKKCENCGGQIELSGKGIAVCPYCGTEYFLT